MRKLLTLEECKDIQREILAVIDRFCKENQIRYSLCGGTLLGAVRHQGYIPWDDDIDIMMPRPDFDRFRSEFLEKGYHVTDLAGRDDCVESFVKVCKDGTVMVDLNFGRELWGVNVDVFPIDGAPSEHLQEHYSKLDSMRQKMFQICPYYKSASKRRLPLFLKYCLKRIVYFYPGSFRSLKKKVVDGQLAFPYEDATTVGPYYWVEKTRAFHPKAVYEDLILLPFEGRLYPCVRQYDRVLTGLFGDYMQLPPVEKRVSHHLYDSFIEE